MLFLCMVGILAVSNGGLSKMKTGLWLLFTSLIVIALGCAAAGTRFADPRLVRQGIVAGDDPGCERATLGVDRRSIS